MYEAVPVWAVGPQHLVMGLGLPVVIRDSTWIEELVSELRRARASRNVLAPLHLSLPLTMMTSKSNAFCFSFTPEFGAGSSFGQL